VSQHKACRRRASSRASCQCLVELMRFLNAMTRADRRTFYRYFAPNARSALLMRDIKALRPPLRRCRLLPARVARLTVFSNGRHAESKQEIKSSHSYENRSMNLGNIDSTRGAFNDLSKSARSRSIVARLRFRLHLATPRAHKYVCAGARAAARPRQSIASILREHSSRANRSIGSSYDSRHDSAFSREVSHASGDSRAGFL